MSPPSDHGDNTWVCPPCRLSILRENSRQPLKPLKKRKPRTQGPDTVFRMEYTEGEQQPAAAGNEGSTDQEPKKFINIFIDLTRLALDSLFGAEPPEAPKPAEENAPIQEPQQPDPNKNGEQSPPQDANGPGATNTESQTSVVTRQTSGPFLDFLHPAFFRPGRNAGRPHAATRAKTKKRKEDKGVKGHRGKQKEVGDGKMTGLESQESERMSKS